MTAPRIVVGYCGENLIPDNVLHQRGHIQTSRALLCKGQFLLIWMTWVLCSEQRLCDFYLRLWCKIKRFVNRFHWCSSPFFTLLHVSDLGYSTMVSITPSGLRRRCPTSRRWHLNSCRADKNENAPASFNGVLWARVKIMLCDSIRRKGEMVQSGDVMSAAVLKRGSKKHTRSRKPCVVTKKQLRN